MVFFDDNMYLALKVENNTGDPVFFFKPEESYIDFFKEYDDEFKLHCYGLVIEIKPGSWKIIER